MMPKPDEGTDTETDNVFSTVLLVACVVLLGLMAYALVKGAF